MNHERTIRERDFIGPDPSEVISRYLETREFAASTVNRLIQRVDEITAALSERGQSVDAFRAWLVANRAGLSWDERQIVAWGREREAEYNAEQRMAAARREAEARAATPGTMDKESGWSQNFWG